VNVLNDRVELISRTNGDIADWLSVSSTEKRFLSSWLIILQERRKVEETYAQGLRKLARRQQRDGGASLGYADLSNAVPRLLT
jgi:F-BAR domain only protein